MHKQFIFLFIFILPLFNHLRTGSHLQPWPAAKIRHREQGDIKLHMTTHNYTVMKINH